MSKVIMNLRVKRNELWEKTKNFLEDHRDENGLVPAPALEQYDKMTADVVALGEEIKRLEDQLELDAKLSVPTSTPIQNSPAGVNKKPVSPTATEEYSKAFWDYFRGDSSLEVRNALSVGVDPAGGFTVPDEFVRPDRTLFAVA